MQITITITLYLIAIFVLIQQFYQNTITYPKSRIIIFTLGIVALGFHASLLATEIVLTNSLDINFFNMLSLINFLVSLIITLLCLSNSLSGLLIILYPLCLIAIILSFVYDYHNLLQLPSRGLQLHILLSITAYSFLMVSAIQAICLAMQEKLIKIKQPNKIIMILPPLKTMEELLIKFIIIGFFLLSLCLVTGVTFLYDMFDQHISHKVFFSSLAWLMYAILLWGRWLKGWRGHYIVNWAIAGFIFLLLAYFGSKFVLEFIIQ